MTFTGYQLVETPGARLLLPLQGHGVDQFWVTKTVIHNEQIEANPFGRRQRITCEIDDWWWQREQQRRANTPAKRARLGKPKLKQAELL